MYLYPTILVAINPNDLHAKQLVFKAATVAKQNQAELHLAYVEKGIFNIQYLYRDEGLFNFHPGKELELIQQLHELSQSSPYPVKNIHFAAGEVIKHLEDLIEEVEAKLVVVGHKNKLTHFFGGIEDNLSADLQCDILQIHSFD
ncbi:universal stress protein [Vibrio sp. CK2-1]|uniref:universal stress protein n=1 Tax=Vibrio sp. CK2-1 TaxID=2912249 RepID=UPI001F4637D0|nr:universal stress protein [Vibrio sp. CK2-1]MCF7353477.1 universal stress protein [Vibrio sp. CK2-1]